MSELSSKWWSLNWWLLIFVILFTLYLHQYLISLLKWDMSNCDGTIVKRYSIMDHESNVREEHQMNHQGQTWAQHHHYASDGGHHHTMDNVVQIIVPELPCLTQGHSENGMTMQNVSTSVQLVGNSINENNVKDPLSLNALAKAAAELDRSDVLHQVENIIEDSKYIEINAGNENKQNVVMHTYSFEEKMPMRELPLAPFLNPNDSDASFYNEIYHYICSGCFPDGVPEVYKKVIKKRATNYMINEQGCLSYGIKNPKEVITSVEKQKNILHSTHIDNDTRVHFGVRKMYDLIFTKYYWRSLYVDVGNTVRNCESCTESSFTIEQSTSSEEIQNSVPELSHVTLPADRIMKVWKKVQVQVFGPYNKTHNNNEYLITIVDPFSKWILARSSSAVNVEYVCSNFLFETFCTFGFAQCQVVGMSSHSFEMMQMHYREHFENVQDILRTLVPFDSEDAQRSFVFTLQDKSAECSWTSELVNDTCINNPDAWDDEISRLLFLYSTTRSAGGGPSPFTVMFARGPTGYISEEEKENVNILEEEKALEAPSNRRRTLKSSTLQCRHCHETFTSKISFRIHQRKHTEEARRNGTLDGEKRLNSILERKMSILRMKKRRGIMIKGSDRLLSAANSSKWCNKLSTGAGNEGTNVVPTNVRQQVTQSTVEAVKNLLNATKDERSKRGKYFKYTPELRDEIAQYALDHSIPAASMLYSSRLGSTVSESSIRNFVKIFKCFSTETKDEIGKYAFNKGVERAALDYSKKLGFEIRKGIVIKFKKMYMKKYYDGGAPGSEFNIPSKKSTSGAGCSRQKRTFSFQTKDEIGRYASTHGITAAMDHFSEKLQFSVKESTVRKFKRQYLERNPEGVTNPVLAPTCSTDQTIGSHEAGSMLTEQQVVHGQAQNMDVLHPLSVINSSNVNSMNNNFVYQHPYSINMAPQVSNNGVNSLTFHQSSVINQGLPYQQPVIMNQSFAPHQTFQQGYSFSNVAQQQGPPHPLAITHASSMGHNLQLTMGQINQAPHVQGSIHPQLIASPYSFDSQTTVSMSEPLSLMKEVESISTSESLGGALSNVTTSVHENVIPTSIIQIPVMEQSSQQIHHHHDMQSEPPQHQMQTMSTHHEGVSVLENQSTDLAENSNAIETQQEEEIGLLSDEEGVDDDFIDYASLPKQPKKKSKKTYRSTYTCGKRGNYVSYSPELRAEIGKYAAQYGNLTAISHFKDKLNIDIPESTVRGLRDKLMMKKIRGEKDVKSLGFAQRGRPMRLGQYDSIVQECIKELLKGGEKVSSFLVIATAKQVLNQYDPSILVENGGHVKLNQTWAKSFLKRIGLSNLS